MSPASPTGSSDTDVGQPHDHGAACGTLHARLRRLEVRRGGHHVLGPLHLDLRCGELLGVVGPNGAGKTSLLLALLREIPFIGSIETPAPAHGHRSTTVGYVPQHVAIDPSAPLRVVDLFRAALGRRPAFLPAPPPPEAVTALTEVGAARLLPARLGDLSGGERQRVLLALALVPRPGLLLLDEPERGLDPAAVDRFYNLVSSLRRRHDLSIVLVSHDLAAVASVADRLLFLGSDAPLAGPPAEILGDARVRRAFGLDLPQAPTAPRTAR